MGDDDLVDIARCVNIERLEIDGRNSFTEFRFLSLEKLNLLILHEKYIDCDIEVCEDTMLDFYHNSDEESANDEVDIEVFEDI